MTIRRKPFHEDLAKTNNLLGRLHIHQGNQLLRQSQSQSQSQLQAKQPVEPIGGTSTVSVPVYKCGIHNYQTTNVKDWSTHAKEYSHGESTQAQAVKGLMQMFGLTSVDYSKGYQAKPRPELIGASAAVDDPKLKAVNELRRWMKVRS